MPRYTVIEHFRAERFETNWGRYLETWLGVDEILYEMCHATPDHTSREDVFQKIAIVDRTYAAGLVRNVPLGEATHILFDNAADIDTMISTIDQSLVLVDRHNAPNILKIHKKLMAYLALAAHGHGVRSFVSKYLHFHRKVIPIYDTIALGEITNAVHVRQRHVEDNAPVPYSEEYDSIYWDYVNRLIFFQEDGDNLLNSTRKLDIYFWQ